MEGCAKACEGEIGYESLRALAVTCKVTNLSNSGSTTEWPQVGAKRSSTLAGFGGPARSGLGQSDAVRVRLVKALPKSCAAATSTSVVRQAPPPTLDPLARHSQSQTCWPDPACDPRALPPLLATLQPASPRYATPAHTRLHLHPTSTSEPPIEPFPTNPQSLQRAASSSSGAESSQWATNATASAATVFAAGSAAWYYYQFGREAHAMTPQEEGYVIHRHHTHPTTQR